MTNPTIDIDLAEILGEIRQNLKQLSSNVSDLKVWQARLEEKVNNPGKDHNEFKESTRKNFDDIKELIEKNNNETKESVTIPTATAATIKSAQTIMAGLFRSTALKLVTTAVTMSVLRSMIMGREKALMQNTKAANREPTMVPTVRKVASCARLG